jgi:uncharacterized MAPEG superfamily protein
MTTPFWCLLAAAFIPYPLAFLGTYYRQRELGSIDNRNPRQQALQLTGAGARCYAAQQNAWEALAVFTAAVTVAHLAGADPARSAQVALVFIAARVVHAASYVADLDKLRGLAFIAGLGCCITLFVLAARSA